MPLLPYCVFLAESAALPQTGVQDRDVLRLDVDGLSVIYSDLGADDIVGDQFQAAALEFHEVVHAVFGERAVIPFRFPTFLTKAELRGHLEKASEEYLTFFRTHGDDVQMEVRLWRFNIERPKPAGGTEYMMRLAEDMMLHQQAVRHVQHVSGNLVREWKTDESRDLMRLFALISRRQIHEFRERLSESPARGNIRMRITGPWPATEFFSGTERRLPPNVVNIPGGDHF